MLAKLNITQARHIMWTWCKPDHLIAVKFRSYQVKEEVFWRDGRKKCFVMTFGSMLAINPFWGNAVRTERKTTKVPQLVSCKDLGLLEVHVFYRQPAIQEPKYCRGDKGHGFLRTKKKLMWWGLSLPQNVRRSSSCPFGRWQGESGSGRSRIWCSGLFQSLRIVTAHHKLQGFKR